MARDSPHLHEREQYDGFQRVAENFWASSTDYADDLLALLEKLLRPTSWQEALARAVAELRRGKWLSHIERLLSEASTIPLWPTQREGLAQALLVLYSQGNVLIADPTGSGKTRLISTLRLALLHQLFERGHGPRPNVVVVCPPAVCEDWDTELRDVGLLSALPVSIGKLSRPTQSSYHRARSQLRLADVLIVDEAHRFIRATSNRSEALGTHAGQYTILATATPINKRPQDLLRLLELLDVDNLPDEQLAEYKRLWMGRFGRKVTAANRPALAQLRQYVGQFLVRRTKRELNEAIARHPEAYRNRLGQLYRFPRVEGQWYQPQSSSEDLVRIVEINRLAQQLRGVLHLRRLQLPAYPLDTEKDVREYLEQRLDLAARLHEYLVRHRLRSSIPALLELAHGTEAATRYDGGFTTHKKSTGNFVGSLRALLDLDPTERLPKVHATFRREWFPLHDWLWSAAAYEIECRREMSIYEQIVALAQQLQPTREQTKAQLLADLLDAHPLVLAFDERLITLDYLRHLLARDSRHPALTAYVVSGHDKNAQVRLRREYALGSGTRRTVALCSDAVAESINLQQASAIVLLDMPGVLRLAEQRQGRVERLDSPHATIASYWPEDPPALKLNADQRLREVIGIANELIKGNLELPASTTDLAAIEPDTVLCDEELFAALQPEAASQREASQWQGLTDSFQLVRELVEGPTALVPPEVYAQIEDLTAGALCRINLLESSVPWSFFALPGDAGRPPRWVLWQPNTAPNFTADLGTICRFLREQLRADAVEVQPFEAEAQAQLLRQAALLRQAERELLPPRKARALRVAESLLKGQHRAAEADSVRAGLLGQVLELFRVPAALHDLNLETVPDYDDLAYRCLELLRPALQKLREAPRHPRRKRPLITLDSLRHDPTAFPAVSEETLRQMLDGVREVPAADYRAVAGIVGIVRVTDEPLPAKGAVKE